MRAAHLKEPRDIELHFALAYTIFNRGDYQESRRTLCPHYQPGSEESIQENGRRDVLFGGVCKASLSDLEGCLKVLERLRKELPASGVVPRSYLLAGQALLRAGKRAEARNQVQEFLNRYPTPHPGSQGS